MAATDMNQTSNIIGQAKKLAVATAVVYSIIMILGVFI